MAGKNQVLLTFAGDDSDLQSKFTKVGAGSEKMGNKVEQSAGKLDRIGEAADSGDTKMMGLADGITGVSDLMKGDLSAAEYAMALSDLGSSVFNFVIPSLKLMSTSLLANGASALTSAGQHVVAAGTTVAGWVAMGFQATLNAAKMAAAWLISLGPLALVVLAIGAVIGILAMMGIGFDDVKAVAAATWGFSTSAAGKAKDWLAKNWPLVLAILTGPFGLATLAIVRNWGTITEFFRGLPGKIGGFFAGLGDIIKSPFTSAFGAIKRLWNSTIGGFGFSGFDPPGPGSIPGFRIPKMHQGGMFIGPGGPGSEGLALLQHGENVSKAGAGGGLTINIIVQGSLVAENDIKQVVRDQLTRGGWAA